MYVKFVIRYLIEFPPDLFKTNFIYLDHVFKILKHLSGVLIFANLTVLGAILSLGSLNHGPFFPMISKYKERRKIVTYLVCYLVHL